jgi:dTDP-4-amino-4,6-dideoxygalactose transaminase
MAARWRQASDALGRRATTSFFPAKPLGCYGDGGATLSNDDAETVLMRSIAFHGASGDDKYNCARIGMNSRLDTIQAAILIEKLAIFADEIRARNEVADRYAQMLEGLVTTPTVIEGGVSTWAQYVVEHERDGSPRICAKPASRRRNIIQSRCTSRRRTRASPSARAA